MDIRQSIIDEIHKIKLSDLSEKEKWEKTIELARELGRIMLEEENTANGVS